MWNGELNAARQEYVRAEREAEEEKRLAYERAQADYNRTGNAREFQKRLAEVDEAYWLTIEEATDKYHSVAIDLFDTDY